MKFLLTISLILFSSFAFPQTMVSGEGRFYAADEDSLVFVKNQLHYQAVRDVITKELRTMGLDDKVFWQSYDTKFKNYFEAIEKQLKEKYANEQGEVPKDKKQDYERTLRAKRLSILANYGRLQGVITSYSVKRMTRSPQSPQSRYYQIDAKTDRRSVNELYLKFTADDADRKYTTLYVSANFALNHMTWNDTGVELGSDFTDVVKDHWKKWLTAKFAGQIQEIVFTDEGLERKLREFLMIPRDLAFNQRVENGDNSIAQLASSLWLKVGMNLDKLHENQLLNKREISIDGDVLLIELKTNRSISQRDLDSEKKNFHTEELKTFSSSLASMVYSKPLEAFDDARKSMSDVSQAKHNYRITVSSLSSIQDLLDVGSLLTTKGVIHQAKTEVVGFDGKSGELTITFRGGRQNLSTFLKGVTGSSVSPGKIIQVNPESPTDMTLLLIDQPSAPLKPNKTSNQG